MNFTCIGFGIIFIIAGVLFACRKLLPRAFKQLPEDERQAIKIKPLCINIGIMIILGGVVLLTSGLWADFAQKAFGIAMIIWFVLCIMDIIYISKSKRYKDK